MSCPLEIVMIGFNSDKGHPTWSLLSFSKQNNNNLFITVLLSAEKHSSYPFESFLFITIFKQHIVCEIKHKQCVPLR